MSLSERVLIVEGYFDRAFVTGALKRLSCASLKEAPVDPWGNKVKGSGQHAFRSASGAFIRIVPVEGSTLDRRVRLVAADAKTRAVEHLLVIPDADLSAVEDPSTKLASKRDNLCGLCGGTALVGEPRAFTAPSLARGEVGVWACADEGSELPPKQNLERLVTAAVRAAHPAWVRESAAFLDHRTEAPSTTNRELAMTLMAGWFSGRYSEGFFEAIWEDAAIAAQLETRLVACGTWPSLERLAR